MTCHLVFSDPCFTFHNGHNFLAQNMRKLCNTLTHHNMTILNFHGIIVTIVKYSISLQWNKENSVFKYIDELICSQWN